MHCPILKINTHQDISINAVGATYPFKTDAIYPYTLNEPIYLLNKDNHVIAHVLLTQLTVNASNIKGEYKVIKVYRGDEKTSITEQINTQHQDLLDPYIYLISSKSAYQDAITLGYFDHTSIKEEGFIHASPKSQLNRVANKFYQDTLEPHVIYVEKTKLNAPLKWEAAAGSIYPHVYGIINAESLVQAHPIHLKCGSGFNIEL